MEFQVVRYAQWQDRGPNNLSPTILVSGHVCVCVPVCARLRACTCQRARARVCVCVWACACVQV